MSSVAFGFLFLPPSAPSSRLFWPPPRSVRQRGSVGSSRLRVGIRRSTCVPGSWSPRFQSTSSSGDLDIAAPDAGRQSETGGGGGWPSLCFTARSWPSTPRWFSPLSRTGLPHARCADVDGAATVAARRRKERRYPELSGEEGRARLVVLACEVGGRFFGGMPPFLEPVVKVQSSGRTASVATEGASRLAPPLGGDVGLQRRPRSGLVVAGAARRTWRGWALLL